MEQKSCNSFIKTQKDLEDLLEGYGIETYKWGKKGTKGVENLFKEIQNGKTELIIRNGNTLVRKIRIVGINLHYNLKTVDNNELSFVLKEVMRIKRDKTNGKYNSQNITKRKHSASVGKKLKIDETALDGAYECLKSKLGIKPTNKFENNKTYIQEQASPSYPDFITLYEANEFDLTLTSSEFLANGYCYEREDDITISQWLLI